MNQWVRIVLSMVLMFSSVTMIAYGIQHRHTLWTGVVTNTVTVTKEVPVPGNSVPPNTTQMQLGPGQFDTGNLEIQDAYENTGKDGKSTGLPSGDYQVLDVNNKIWMLKLCQPQNNGVLPKFDEGSVVNIIYSKEPDCYRFLSAQLIRGKR